MPKEIRSRLLDDPARHARLGGEAQDVAVMFVDIRGFTRFAEHHPPKDVVAVLNRTLMELTEPLRVYEGILDKYIGDGFLAFFEASPDLADAARRAARAARAMQDAFANLWTDSPNAALRELGLGIGISTGRVVVGNVGTEDAMDYTVVGDAVNVAARLQSMAEPGDVLVSDTTYSLLESGTDAVCMRLTKLRGREEPLDVYRLNGA
jgi:adenylate cyclase